MLRGLTNNRLLGARAFPDIESRFFPTGPYTSTRNCWSDVNFNKHLARDVIGIDLIIKIPQFILYIRGWCNAKNTKYSI